jgi:hypothetical protein
MERKMETNEWSGLDTRQWWFGVLVIAGPTLVAAVYAGRTTLTIIGTGVVAWAFGEWIQHPYQQFRKDGHIGDAYHRRWSVFGVLLNALGIGLVLLGTYRFWKLGGLLF